MVRCIILLPCLASVVAVAALSTPPFTQIIAFGDSMVDLGQGAWKLTNGTFPPDSAGYYEHRITNGITWVETLASLLAIPVKSYGVGGTTTVNNQVCQGFTGRLLSVRVPSLQDQVDKFIATNTLRPEQARNVLWVISAGSMNAYMSRPGETSGSSAATDIKDVVWKLKAIGGYRFIIPGIPMRGGKAVGGTFVPTIESARLVRFAMSFREALAMMLTADSSLMSPDFYQWILDLQGPLQKGAFDPTKFALSCINGLYFPTKAVPTGWTACRDWEKYIWFDEYNPTRSVHQMWGIQVQRALVAKRWIW